MRLLSCYVENFGTLHRFEQSFSEGINVMLKENGWGKSTFAAFIRAMFYGLDSGRSRKDLNEAERKKYMPWQGGAYGGNICFQIGEKKYRAERFFGKNQKDDSFVLYDLDTGLVSDDYSENLGEELFGLDRKAYSSSTYIPQSEVRMENNDSISAKLGQGQGGSVQDDMENFSHAQNQLTLARQYYKKIGKKGRINELKNSIEEIGESIGLCSAKMAAGDEWKKQQRELENKKRAVTEEIRRLRAMVEQSGQQEASRILQEQSRRLEQKIAECQDKLKQYDNFFCKGIPEDGKLGEIKGMTGDLNLAEREQEIFALTQEEKQLLQQKYEGAKISFVSWLAAAVIAVISAVLGVKVNVFCFAFVLVSAAILYVAAKKKEQENRAAEELENRKKQVLEKEAKYQTAVAKTAGLKSRLTAFFADYEGMDGSKPEQQIAVVEQKKREYQNLDRTLAELKKEHQGFQERNRQKLAQKPSEMIPPPGQLQQRLEEQERELEELNVRRRSVERQLEEIAEEGMRLQELSEEKERLSEELMLCEEKLRVIEQTAQLLEEAKNRYTSRYLKGITTGFETYLSAMGELKLGEPKIDVNLEVTFSENGESRELAYYSAGYRDLIGLCTRCALVDALFLQEKPFLILDDPMVNLDEEKFACGKRMLEKLSERYQVIYFACHGSRALEK